MNIQAMMQQAEKLQKEILNTKKEIEDKTFSIKKEIVNVEVNGKKKIQKIEINKANFQIEDLEILEDMILLAINELFETIDKEMEQKLNKFGPGIKGMI